MPPLRTPTTFPTKSLPAARRIAALTVHAALYKNQDLQFALDQTVKQGMCTSRDKGLATELAYGYLRNKSRSDFLVTSFLKSPEKLPSHFLLLLGLAAYELTFLDKIPTYATVNWAVEWIKKNLSTRLAGVGNAVLRRIAGLKDQARQPDFFNKDHPDPTTFLARYYSCPPWIVTLWLQNYGEEKTHAFLQSSISRPPLGLRSAPELTPGMLTHTLQGTLLRQEGHALALKTSPDNLETLLAEGKMTRQSFAAQAALTELDAASWPTPVWDACCGRGGKSMALDDQGIAPLWASDLHKGRLLGFARECARTGRTIPIFRASAKDAPPLRSAPQTILLDVPCSGLGVLSRRPDSKWKRSPQDVAALIHTQQAIVDKAWTTIPTGGCIVYLTCTLNPAENQEQIARICREHAHARLEKEYQTGTHEELGEFFYGAVIRKTGLPD